MNQAVPWLLSGLMLLVLIGCNQPDADAPGTTVAVPAEAVDRDPTPQTGTGGPTETAPDPAQ